MPEKIVTRNILPNPVKSIGAHGERLAGRVSGNVLHDIRGIVADKLISRVFRSGKVIPQPGYDRLKLDQDNILASAPISSAPLRGNLDRNLYIQSITDINYRVKIQTVPRRLNYNPESEFIAIKSVARNNPLYHYTGGEDTLEFELDWYSTTENREDVILSCKLVEALSKNDGYDNPPHRVKLIWGGNKYLSEATWLVTAAPYSLELFNPEHSMLPQQAYQKVSLKRVTEFNQSRANILSINH